MKEKNEDNEQRSSSDAASSAGTVPSPANKKSNSNMTTTVGLLVACLGGAAYAAWGTSPSALAAAPTAAPNAPPADAVDTPTAGGPGGVVKEVLQVPSYTYLRLETADGGEIWAAVNTVNLEKGAEVQLQGASLMVNFHSKELDRTFSEIYFGNLTGAGSPAAGGELPPGHPPVEGAAPGSDFKGPHSMAHPEASAVAVSKSSKAEGNIGYTVAELHEKGDELDGKRVRVRGTVVKLTKKVMGTNFLHVQDATGSAVSGSHDLTLKVAKEPPALGTEALFEGTLRTNVDLGAGYNFEVIIEEGRVVSE